MEKLLIFLCVLVVQASGARILFMPFDHHAHVNYYCNLGQELQGRGHQVDVFVSNRSVHIPEKAGLNTIVTPYKEVLDPELFEKMAFGGTDHFATLKYVINLTIGQTRDVFNDKAFLAKLKENNYDLILIDGDDLFRMMYLLPYYLDVKFMTTHLRNDAWVARVPSLPSVEGFVSLIYMDENSTFLDRLTSLLARIATQFILAPPSYFFGITDDLFDELIPEKLNIGFEKLSQKSEMYLVNLDIICLDSHRVSAPHYQFIGGLGARDPKPLPVDLDKFMNASKDGAIVLTFGSGLKTVPMDMLGKLMSAFKDLKQNVIMRHVGEMPEVIPKNVLIQSWIPQNDLLAHRNTELFITHAGGNGQREGVYHGVPMIMMPFFSDQDYNANRGVKRGYGIRMDPHTFSAQELKENIMEIINNPSYKNKILKCSKILHSLPSPQDKAAFWIEHILQFGGSHLRPYFMDMPLWKYFMLDIIVFFLIIDSVVILALRWCYRKCKGSKTKKSKTE